MIIFVTTYGHEYSVASLAAKRFGVPVPDVHVMLYDKLQEESAEAPAGFIPSKRSLKTRIEHWISGTQY